MIKKGLLLVIFLFAVRLVSQITCSPEDRLLFKSKITELKQLELGSMEHTMVSIGKTFLGTPYLEKTLEIGEEETLVVNLRGLDCTTFVENVLAFSVLQKKGDDDFESFANTLKTIRYRYGFLNGYSSRLHYFTEWIRNNNEKGIVKEITSDLGGIEVEKSINFMGTHRDLYPFLADDANFNTMLGVEAELAKEPLCILPQKDIEAVEDKLQNGDIIALATAIKGLDVTHTGIAIRQPDGRIHLLHASISGEVKITEEPLVDYLKKIKSNTGIIVARPL
ncbi:MAG: N-acetylmuramoyl-L-alanine amidase-like domain-containing protein [Bacteroidota bacterium]